MLSNKHVIVALLVAPLLALIAYFAVDLLLSEKPQAAQQGAAYALVAKANCRYQSGRCSLTNGDVRINLYAEAGAIDITSSHPGKALRIAVAAMDSEELVLRMEASDDARHWRVKLPLTPADSQLRLAMNIAGSHYYAETGLTFAALSPGATPSTIKPQ